VNERLVVRWKGQFVCPHDLIVFADGTDSVMRHHSFPLLSERVHNHNPLRVYDGGDLDVPNAKPLLQHSNFRRQVRKLPSIPPLGAGAVWTQEIRLRASVRIGELVRELDTVERARTDLDDSDVGQSKTKAIENAGLNVRTAQRYQELAGPREQQAQNAQRLGFLFQPCPASMCNRIAVDHRLHSLDRALLALARSRVIVDPETRWPRQKTTDDTSLQVAVTEDLRGFFNCSPILDAP
jgi:hypothetical protein